MHIPRREVAGFSHGMRVGTGTGHRATDKIAYSKAHEINPTNIELVRQYSGHPQLLKYIIYNINILNAFPIHTIRQFKCHMASNFI